MTQPVGSRSAQHRAKGPRSNRTLILAVAGLLIVVMALGGLVIFLQLNPQRSASLGQSRIDIAKRAIRENPGDPSLRAALGLAYAAADDIPGARGAFEEALELDPDQWVANYQLALILSTEDPERAKQLLERAAKNAPEQRKVGPFTVLGNILYAEGRYKDAKDAYVRGVADFRSILDARLGLARSYAALGKFKDALVHMGFAIDLSDQDPSLIAEWKQMKSKDWTTDTPEQLETEGAQG